MTMLCKKLLSSLMVLVMLLSLMPAALAEETTLKVTLTGVTSANKKVELSAVFDVYQDNQKLGMLTVIPGGQNTIALPGDGSVALVPVAGTYPAEYPLNVYGYGVAIMPGRLNVAPIEVQEKVETASKPAAAVTAAPKQTVKATATPKAMAAPKATAAPTEAPKVVATPAPTATPKPTAVPTPTITPVENGALFILAAEVQASFELYTEEGEKVLSFKTDKDGYYVSDKALPEGSYLLRMTSKDVQKWPEMYVDLWNGDVQLVRSPFWNPLKSGNLNLRAAVTVVPDGYVNVTPAPTAVPTAAPTVKPTAAPTAEPTVAPTVEPTTAAPTAEPVAEPAAATDMGGLILMAEGLDVEAKFVMSRDGKEYGSGMLSLDSAVYVDGVPAGNYLFTLHMPDNAAVVALNGNPTLEVGKVEWMGTVVADQDGSYSVEFGEVGAVRINTGDTKPTNVTMTAPLGRVETLAGDNGVYMSGTQDAGEYTVTVYLPAGEYVADASAWKMTRNADGTWTAVAKVNLTVGKTIELPTLSIKPAPATATPVVTAAPAKSNKAAATAQPVVNNTNNFTGNGKPAKITIHAFVDANSNGSCGNNEKDKSNVQVSLIDMAGEVAAAGATDRDGEVTLSVNAGTYYVKVAAPAGFGFGPKGNGYTLNQSIMSAAAGREQQSGAVELEAGKTLKTGIGLVEMGGVAGTVWNDLNGDGIWQTGEPGIAGIQLYLEGKKNGLKLETVTDANGEYAFTQASDGVYVLKCVVPDEYVTTQKVKDKKPDAETLSIMTTEADRIGEAEVTVKNGKTAANNNIGLVDGVIISGMCFFDANHNGIYDEGDQPLPGVELRLARQSNNVLLQHVVSDENGEYRFVGQRGSTFTLRANLDKGYFFTVLSDDPAGNQFKPNGEKTERRLTDITLENGAHQTINLGALKYGSIEGRVYYDKNFSGKWEKGEKLETGKTVTLYNENGEQVATKKTNNNGLYTFTKLMPGKYYVGMEQKKGYAFTSMGGDNLMQAQLDGTGRTTLIDLTLGQDVENAGAGLIVPAYVKGVFYADANDNGQYDKGESALEGTVIYLMNENGAANAITMGKSAEFTISAAPGTYYLQYELPEGGIFVEGSQEKTDWFTLGTNDEHTVAPCGAYMLTSFSGMTFTDSNGNSVMDEAETPLAGVSFILTSTRGETVVVSDEDGWYAFRDLRPDQYTLTVQLPGDAVLSRIPDVKLGLTHGKNSQTIALNLPMGTQLFNQDMGCVIPSSWAGEAYMDENYDGVRSGDEAPAVGEKIVLMDALTGEAVFTVLTDENGRFLIEGIAPGEYELTYPMDEGNLVPFNGSCDFYQNGDMMTNGRVTILGDEHRDGTVLCVARTTEISGTVMLHETKGNTPIAAATVHLLDGYGNQLKEIVTGVDGKYAFKGLMPGDYALDVTIPTGYVLVENDDPLLPEAGLVTFVEDAQGHYGKSSVIDLRMADHHTNMDVITVLPGRLGDKVWLDLNANGLQDGEEGGIPGVTIELLRDGNVLTSTVSDQYGYYIFEELYPADYTLRATWPAEVIPTQLRTDVGQIVSVLQADGTSIPVRVTSNKANYAADLGFVLVEEGKFPAGYGEGEKQIWKKK